jgi:hypothetical protein
LDLYVECHLDLKLGVFFRETRQVTHDVERPKRTDVATRSFPVSPAPAPRAQNDLFGFLE